MQADSSPSHKPIIGPNPRFVRHLAPEFVLFLQIPPKNYYIYTNNFSLHEVYRANSNTNHFTVCEAVSNFTPKLSNFDMDSGKSETGGSKFAVELGNSTVNGARKARGGRWFLRSFHEAKRKGD
jgi:hypothetical protein